ENAETARINRQAFGEPILSREVCDHFAVTRRPRIFHVRIEALAGKLVLRDEARVRRHLFERGLRNAAQHHDRVIAGVFPQRRLETAEQRANGRLPCPQDVIRQLLHPPELWRERRTNDEFTNGMNVGWHAICKAQLNLSVRPGGVYFPLASRASIT